MEPPDNQIKHGGVSPESKAGPYQLHVLDRRGIERKKTPGRGCLPSPGGSATQRGVGANHIDSITESPPHKWRTTQKEG